MESKTEPTSLSTPQSDCDTAKAHKRTARAKSQHRASIWFFVTVIVLFFVLNTFIELPQWALVTSYTLLLVAAVATMFTTMNVMINKSPGAHPNK